MFWPNGNGMFKARIVKKRRAFDVTVSLALERGESLGLFGATGTGKSTVLACIAGIEQPDDGEVILNNDRLFPPPLPLHLRPLGYLTQEPGLFPHLSVGENVTFGVPTQRAADHDYLSWIATLRDRLQLGSLWHASASRISGGQARRVALARMLARRPTLVLLDEPFAGLDRELVRVLIEDLIGWSQLLGFGMIAVDHQAEVLQRLCPKRVMVIENGNVAQAGTWEELRQRPATPLLRSLLAPL
jgi:ABC-type sulfate/molybdate transport systems ATPase subunit